jgi:phage tail P2-like protein
MTSLLPPNATLLERSTETSMHQPMANIKVPVRDLWNPSTCPLALLPWLAWALSVDEWDQNWSEDQKRGAIAESVAIHAIKGTLASVKRVLAAAGYGDSTVLENLDAQERNGSITRNGHYVYGDGGDEWAQYRVYLTRPITIGQATQVRRMLNNTAPARCHLAGLHYTQALNIHNGAIHRDNTWTRGVA